jgi:hypothetical protein
MNLDRPNDQKPTQSRFVVRAASLFGFTHRSAPSFPAEVDAP